MVLLLGLAGACGGQARPSVAEESAAAQATAGGVAQRATSPLAISLDDYDFSQQPGVLQRILSSPHAYFRFINRRFTQAVCRRFESDLGILANVNLHGDAHLENYVVTDRQRGLADFDDSSAGPFVLDLVRFGVSIHLASRQLGWGDQSEAIVASFIEGYRTGLRSGELGEPEPALVGRIRAGLPNRRPELLAAAEALMEPVDESGRDFERALPQYQAQMRHENPQLPPGFFDVKAMGALELGIGSAFSEKYLMRVEGPTADPDDDLILEAKAIRDLEGIDCIQRPRVEVSRVMIAQARMAFKPPRYVGAIILHPYLGFQRRQKFWVNAWEDSYFQLTIAQSFKTPQDLFAVARDAGMQLGRGQPKSIADPYEAMLRRRLEITTSNLRADIMVVIRDLTRETIAAWQEVRAQARIRARQGRPPPPRSASTK